MTIKIVYNYTKEETMKISIMILGIIFMLISTFSYACTGITIKLVIIKWFKLRTIEYGEGDLNSKL